MSLAPIEHRVQVTLSPADAFDLFTRQMARWWPFAGHSCFDDQGLDVQFEPRVGGAVTEVARDGRRMGWGTLTRWEPPDGFAMRWHPGLDAAQATLLQVRFIAAEAGGTVVHVHHSGWEARGDEAASKRDAYDGGWPVTLAAYRAFAAQREGAHR